VWTVAALLVAPIAAQETRPRFEVASVKRASSTIPMTAPIPRAFPGGRFRADFTTVDGLLWFAYGVRQDFVFGGPDWVRRDTFEISAAAATDAPADQIKLMVQSLLEDRFKLVTHVEKREMRYLALVPARPNSAPGPNLVRIEECSAAAVNALRRDFPEKYPRPAAGMIASCSSRGLGDLATLFSMGGERVVDTTGFTDSFYYTLRSQFSPASALLGRISSDSDLPALSTALEEQLGVKLESRRGPLDVLVIDSIQEPTEN
jgi:uncharacterized protein (TIGR03435 family)